MARAWRGHGAGMARAWRGLARAGAGVARTPCGRVAGLRQETPEISSVPHRGLNTSRWPTSGSGVRGRPGAGCYTGWTLASGGGPPSEGAAPTTPGGPGAGVVVGGRSGRAATASSASTDPEADIHTQTPLPLGNFPCFGFGGWEICTATSALVVGPQVGRPPGGGNTSARGIPEELEPSLHLTSTCVGLMASTSALKAPSALLITTSEPTDGPLWSLRLPPPPHTCRRPDPTPPWEEWKGGLNLVGAGPVPMDQPQGLSPRGGGQLDMTIFDAASPGDATGRLRGGGTSPQGAQEDGAGVAHAWRGRGAGAWQHLVWGGAGLVWVWRRHAAGLFPQGRGNFTAAATIKRMLT
eukprot:gene5882-biopygen8825